MNTYRFRGKQPQIPAALLHKMHELESGAVFSHEMGGQWIPGSGKKTAFKGIVLPVTDKDLVRDVGGTITKDSVKIYTNGHSLAAGSRVEDDDGSVYTITQELNHNALHPIKRYLAERKGKAARR